MCEGADKVKEKKVSATDDVCFLCKDGGDLIECDDCKSRNCDSRKRCKKVYHSYCLAYVVEDDGRDWRCPRHFCDYCGTVNLKYVCKFCPMSICKGCPAAMVRKVRENRSFDCVEIVVNNVFNVFSCVILLLLLVWIGAVQGSSHAQDW